MEPGRIVEFIEGRQFTTGLVTRVKGTKVSILSENDRELSLTMNRIVHMTSPGYNPSHPRHELVKRLKDLSAHRESLAQKVDVHELWELLEGEGESFGYDFLAELSWPGPVSADQVAAMYRVVFSDGLFFKMRPDMAWRHDAEKVEQISLAKSREEEREREIEQGSAWLADVWADAPTEEPPCRDRLVRILRDIALYQDGSADYKYGLKLLNRAGLGSDPGKPFKLLVKLGEMSFHENLPLLREGLLTGFSKTILSEAEELATRCDWRDEQRRDLTGLEVITADSGGARDFDDAVSLEEKDGRLFLGVHIADVSAVIKPDSILDHAGRERATSIYMPDQRLTMLPEILSEECLSLKAGELRPAFSMVVELTENGDIVGYEFFPSLVKVKRQLSYQEVDETIDQDPLLSRLFHLSQMLKENRIKNGAMILPLPKLNVYLTPEGEIGVNLTHWENPGRSMISEFMILNNHVAAKYLLEHDAGCYYRSQTEPSERIVPGGTDCSDLFLCLQQRRYLQRVLWSMSPLPHRGMGLDVYTNLTSPLRRYIDLIIQRQLRSVSAGGQPIYTAEEMSDILTLTETVRRKVMRVQNERRRYWLLRYLEGQGSKEYEALVLEKLPHRWRIFLPELMMDANLPLQSGRVLEPGQTIGIGIKKVDAREDILKFNLT